MSRLNPPGHPTQMRLLALVPSVCGITTDDLGDAAQEDGLNVTFDPSFDALTIDGYPLYPALRRMRRKGWLIFDRHVTPPVWARTPTGTARLNHPVPAPPRMEVHA